MSSRAKKKSREIAVAVEKVSPANGLGFLSSIQWEDRAIYLVMVAVLVLTNYPYFVGLWMTKVDDVFTGVFFNDMLSYIAKMRDGYEGFWHYTNRYTTEPTKPSLLFMFYVFLGHVARWLGLSLVATFHLSRIAAAVLMMFAIRRLIYKVGLREWGAICAFVLCFSIASLPIPYPAHLFTEKFYYVSEGHEFLAITYFPHLAMSTAFLVLILTDFLVLARREALGWTLAALSIESMLMAWIHPRMLLTAGLIGWIMASLIIIQEKRIPWRLAFGGIVFAVSGGFTAVTIMNSYRGDEILEFWATVATLSPNPVATVWAYGLMIPLGIIGARIALRAQLPGAQMLTLWLLVGIGLCYYPTGFQRRMFQGLDIPLALAAGYAIHQLIEGYGRKASFSPKQITLAVVVALAVCNLKLLPTIKEIYAPAQRAAYPWYFSTSQWAGFEWLRENTGREEIVLSTDLTGQAIPGYSGNRVFVGHWAETFRRLEKNDEFFKFRDSKTSSQWRRIFVQENKIRYLYWSSLEFDPTERPEDLVIYNPDQDPDLWRVAFVHPSEQAAKVIIFESVVVGAESADRPIQSEGALQ